MAFDAVLTVSDGAANHVYEIVDSSKPFAILRQVDPASGQLDLFQRLHIAHSRDEKKRMVNTKVEFSANKENTTTGELKTAKVRLVGEIPQDTFDAAEIAVLFRQLKNFLIDANITKLTNMES